MTCKLDTHAVCRDNQSQVTETSRDYRCFHYARLTVGYPRKMGRHFAIRPGQPRGMANFDLTFPTGQKGLPHEYFGRSCPK